MNKNIILLRILLILALSFFLILLFYWFPNSIIDDINNRIQLKYVKESDKYLSISIMLTSNSICCILSIFIIVLLWMITNYVKNDKFFSKNVVRILFIIVLTLGVSSALFVISNVIYFNLKWSNYPILYLFFSIFNIALIPFFMFLYFLMKKQCLTDFD